MPSWRKYVVPVFLLLVMLVLVFRSGGAEPALSPQEVAVFMVDEGREEKWLGFRDALAQFGWLEGENIQFSFYRLAQQERERLEHTANLIMASQPDLIVTMGGIETRTILEVNQSIPTLFIGVAAPHEWGLVKPKFDPLVTGISNGQYELVGKRLELISILFPHVEEIWVIVDPEAPPSQVHLEKVRQEGVHIEQRLVEKEVHSYEELQQLLQALPTDSQVALLPLPSYLLEGNLVRLLPQWKEHGVFVMGFYPEQVEAGLFAAYGASFYDQGAQAARLAAKILHGQDVRQIPWELPDHVQLVGHYSSLEQIGKSWSAAELAWFDRVVK